MLKLTFGKVALVIAALTTAGTVLGPATAGAESPMPMTSKWRTCDFEHSRWVKAVGDARAVAQVTPSSGDGTFVVNVQLATALPNTRYDVRVIQTPRPSNGCAPGDPGVTTGVIQTDGVGIGSLTLQPTVAAGKTGAWVVVERPSAYSQTPAEFYTSDFIAAI